MTTILLIEDDQLFRSALADTLAERGYRVIQAADGEQGLSCFRAEPADLVITDLVMPKREGIETIGDLRRLAPRLGIIAMSGGLAHKPANYLKIAGALGADRTLKKPFPLPVLFETIRDVLNQTANQPESHQAMKPPPIRYAPASDPRTGLEKDLE